MGTNYYAEIKPECCHCNRPYERLHIGKSSAGWPFSFQALAANRNASGEMTYTNHPDLNSFQAWKAFLCRDGVKIFDEYGNPIKLQALLDLIESKRCHKNDPIVLDAYRPKDHFHDSEGHPFSSYEFF